jgi:PH (Pleckstrin Homology) domain-containing protein/putative oligomerization/nucleic acid binding protein
MADVSNVLRQFVNEEQDPKVVEQVLARVKDILTTGEEVKYIAVQKKPVVNLAPDSAVLTNKRFIIYKPTLIGGVSFVDYPWRDLKDAQVREGLLSATLFFQTIDGRPHSIDSLPKAQARRLYAMAQEMEEKVREERRQRELEDKRAAAGGVVVQAPVAHQPAPASAAAPDPLATLQKLKGMLDAGLITSAEYDAKKAEILASM